MSVIKYNNIQDAIMNANRITICTSGKEYVLIKDSFQYELVMNFVEDILEDSHQMPALGVSLNDEVVAEKKHKDWVEFSFNEKSECGGMFFDGLLIFIEKAMGGVNIFRKIDGKYEGRCFYINLSNQMDEHLKMIN